MLLCQNEDEAEAEEDKNWPSPDIELSSEVQDILQASWKHLQERIETLGVVSFLSIFETHPDALNTFLPQVEIDSLEFHKMDKLYREKLRVHGLRVMSVVEKTMHRLGSNQRCLKMLKVFGRTHKRYQIPPSMLGYMGRSFMAAIEPTLTEDNAWNAEIKEAWASLFILITDGMQRGYDAADDTAAVVRFEEPPTVVAFLEETTAEEDEDESAFD